MTIRSVALRQVSGNSGFVFLRNVLVLMLSPGFKRYNHIICSGDLKVYSKMCLMSVMFKLSFVPILNFQFPVLVSRPPFPVPRSSF